jgi:hypothetical protein
MQDPEFKSHYHQKKLLGHMCYFLGISMSAILLTTVIVNMQKDVEIMQFETHNAEA